MRGAEQPLEQSLIEGVAEEVPHVAPLRDDAIDGIDLEFAEVAHRRVRKPRG